MTLVQSISRMLGVKNEPYYCRILAEMLDAEMEHVLFNDRRVDLLFTAGGEDYATEVDWCQKWAEGIGQSIYYAAVTQRKAGLILLTKRSRKDDERDIASARLACSRTDIRLWTYSTKELDDDAK